MPLHHLDDIDERDLSDAPRLAKEDESYALKFGFAAAAALFLGLLVYSSFPELSPKEIVSMEGYEGEQPTRHIFNMDSLENRGLENPAEKPLAEELATQSAPETPAASNIQQAQEVQDSAESVAVETDTAGAENASRLAPIAVTEPVPEVAPPEVSAPEVLVSEDQSATDPVAVSPVVEPDTVESVTPLAVPVAAVDQADTLDEEVIETEEVEVPEAPESPPVVSVEPVRESSPTSAAIDESAGDIRFSTVPQDRVVAAMATTPPIVESNDTVVVASVAALEPVPVPVGSATLVNQAAGDGATQRLLPLRSVIEDATAVKATPSAQSRTVLSLDRGVIVTAFEQAGEWVHVGTNDGSSITGYVRDSALQRLETQP